MLSFCLCSFREHRFYHRLILLRSISWCSSLRYVLNIIFPVSILTTSQSCFLRCVIIFSDTFLFKISAFIFPSYIPVCSVWFGRVEFPLLLLLYSSFRLQCSYFSVFWCVDYCIRVLLLDSQFTFWCISNISKPENQPFFFIILTWPATLWLVIWNLVYSFQIFIIIFL